MILNLSIHSVVQGSGVHKTPEPFIDLTLKYNLILLKNHMRGGKNI